MLDTATSPNGGDALQNLLSVMPGIAAAVEMFSSEDSQRTVLAACLSAYGLPGKPPASTAPYEPGLSVVPPLKSGTAEEFGVEENGTATTGGSSASARRRSPKKRSAIRPVDIDFRPEGKTSLVDFVALKAPVTTIAEKCAVAIYYLAETLGVEAIEPGHVLAAFRECNWPDPAPSMYNALQVNASKKNWFLTSDMKHITLTSQGRNQVHHLMPRKSTKSA